MNQKRTMKLTKAQETVRLGNRVLQYRGLRVSKLLYKTELTDEGTHWLKLDICGHAIHKDIDENGKVSLYTFMIPFVACEDGGIVSYTNVDTWDWISQNNYRMEEIDLTINTTIDNELIAQQTNPIIIELEFSNAV